MVRKLKPRTRPTLRRPSPLPRRVALQEEQQMRDYSHTDYSDEQVEEMYEEIPKEISLEILERSRINWDAKAAEMYANWLAQKSQVVEDRGELSRQLQIKQFRDQFLNCMRSSQVIQVKINKLKIDLAQSAPVALPSMDGANNGDTV